MPRAASSSPVPGHTPPPPWPHQKQTLTLCLAQPRVLDTSDPGTGKTRVQVERYAARPKATRGRWLVVCPRALMQSAWGNDIERFAPELTVSYARADNREEALRLNTDVVVMNTDGVKWFFETEGRSVKAIPARIALLKDFDHLTIDEITYFKHASSQRSKAMAALRKFFKYRYGMTGTPTPKSVMELWHPMLVLDDGKRLGTSYYKLRSAVQLPVQSGPRPEHVTWEDKPGAAQAINELIGDITIRHEFEQVMTHVPPNHRDVKMFELSPRAAKLYAQMEQEAIIALNDRVISAVHAASLRTKLLQIASGAVYNGDGTTYSVLDKQRYELIADLVEERDICVVFFNWKHQRDLLGEEFTKRDLPFCIIDGDTKSTELDSIVKAFQAGKYRAVLIHPRTGAHGLTLTRAKTTILSSPIYEADLLKQGIHRIYRGEQNSVTNTLLVQAKGTVEDLVYERLNGRYESMQDLLQMMAQRHK